MSVKDDLNAGLREALRSGDENRKNAFRMALAAIHNAEIEAGRPFEDGDAVAVVAKQIKQRHDSIDAFRKGGRQDLVDKEEAEVAALQGFLPQQMTRDEIMKAAREVIEEVGAKGPQDKGKVMSALMGRVRGRAEGRDVNEVVTEALKG